LSMPQACGGRAIDAAKIRDIASWLMQRGADPHQQASKTAPKRVTWDIENSDDADDKEHDADDEKDKTGTAMPVRSHTAISSLICLRYSMRASDERKDHDDDDDDDDDDDYDSWTEELTALDQLLQVFISGAAQAIQNEKVTVDVRVIDFWDEMRRDDSKHDVMLDTADGPVGAHQMVLTRASSMLAAMLSSGMREGQEQRIPCEDTTANATGLLLDLLYTGSTTQDVTLDNGLSVFELAHRWQVQHVLPIAERLLIQLLAYPRFESIAELAVLKGSRSFEQAVSKWGKASKMVKNQLDAGGFSPAVRKLLGEDDEPAVTRKRKSF